MPADGLRCCAALPTYICLGPVDLVVVTKNGEISLFDAKADSFRINPSKRTPHRIYRVRKKIQRDLGVKIAYVDADGKVSITDHD